VREKGNPREREREARQVGGRRNRSGKFSIG